MVASAALPGYMRSTIASRAKHHIPVAQDVPAAHLQLPDDFSFYGSISESRLNPAGSVIGNLKNTLQWAQALLAYKAAEADFLRDELASSKKAHELSEGEVASLLAGAARLRKSEEASASELLKLRQTSATEIAGLEKTNAWLTATINTLRRDQRNAEAVAKTSIAEAAAARHAQRALADVVVLLLRENTALRQAGQVGLDENAYLRKNIKTAKLETAKIRDDLESSNAEVQLLRQRVAMSQQAQQALSDEILALLTKNAALRIAGEEYEAANDLLRLEVLASKTEAENMRTAYQSKMTEAADLRQAGKILSGDMRLLLEENDGLRKAVQGAAGNNANLRNKLQATKLEAATIRAANKSLTTTVDYLFFEAERLCRVQKAHLVLISSLEDEIISLRGACESYALLTAGLTKKYKSAESQIKKMRESNISAASLATLLRGFIDMRSLFGATNLKVAGKASLIECPCVAFVNVAGKNFAFRFSIRTAVTLTGSTTNIRRLIEPNNLRVAGRPRLIVGPGIGFHGREKNAFRVSTLSVDQKFVCELNGNTWRLQFFQNATSTLRFYVPTIKDPRHPTISPEVCGISELVEEMSGSMFVPDVNAWFNAVSGNASSPSHAPPSTMLLMAATAEPTPHVVDESSSDYEFVSELDENGWARLWFNGPTDVIPGIKGMNFVEEKSVSKELFPELAECGWTRMLLEHLGECTSALDDPTQHNTVGTDAKTDPTLNLLDERSQDKKITCELGDSGLSPVLIEDVRESSVSDAPPSTSAFEYTPYLNTVEEQLMDSKLVCELDESHWLRTWLDAVHTAEVVCGVPVIAVDAKSTDGKLAIQLSESGYERNVLGNSTSALENALGNIRVSDDGSNPGVVDAKSIVDKRACDLEGGGASRGIDKAWDAANVLDSEPLPTNATLGHGFTENFRLSAYIQETSPANLKKYEFVTQLPCDRSLVAPAAECLTREELDITPKSDVERGALHVSSGKMDLTRQNTQEVLDTTAPKELPEIWTGNGLRVVAPAVAPIPSTSRSVRRRAFASGNNRLFDKSIARITSTTAASAPAPVSTVGESRNLNSRYAGASVDTSISAGSACASSSAGTEKITFHDDLFFVPFPTASIEEGLTSFDTGTEVESTAAADASGLSFVGAASRIKSAKVATATSTKVDFVVETGRASRGNINRAREDTLPLNGGTSSGTSMRAPVPAPRYAARDVPAVGIDRSDNSNSKQYRPAENSGTARRHGMRGTSQTADRTAERKSRR
ncbi:hypothetical protein HDU96_010705 [Phlyctochytrium bullatum]|nr:hypothetical protein HDU96_010705 [Phlyctochytrium bullatum]